MEHPNDGFLEGGHVVPEAVRATRLRPRGSALAFPLSQRQAQDRLPGRAEQPKYYRQLGDRYQPRDPLREVRQMQVPPCFRTVTNPLTISPRHVLSIYDTASAPIGCATSGQEGQRPGSPHPRRRRSARRRHRGRGWSLGRGTWEGATVDPPPGLSRGRRRQGLRRVSPRSLREAIKQRSVRRPEPSAGRPLPTHSHPT